MILMLFFAVFLLATVTAGYITRKEVTLSNRIYPNVYLDNVNVGEKTKKEALTPYRELNQNLKRSHIKVFYKKEQIATLSASTLGVQSNADEVLDRAYLIGRTPRNMARIYQKISAIFGLAKFNFYSSIKYDKSKIDEFIIESEEKYNKPAKDALFKFEGGRVVSFRPEEKGVRIESDKLLREVEKNIRELALKIDNKSIILTEQIIEPEIILANSNSFGIEELIGEGKSDFTGSIPNRIHNIKLSSFKFNGVLIPRDKTISFNEIVGDISGLTGYQQAYIIKSGRTVLGDGGGVCQTSTTLFRAALNTGLPILERWAHAYRVGYYENDSKPGFDATVYAPTNDLKIKNNTPASILIQTEIVGNILYFKLYGKRDDRKVQISDVTIWDQTPAPPPSYQDDPTLKKGTTKQVDFAASGAKTNFEYKVTSASNQELNFEKKFFSSFRPWQAVYLVGQAD